MTIGNVIAASSNSRPTNFTRAMRYANSMPASVASTVAHPATLRVSIRGTRTSLEVITAIHVPGGLPDRRIWFYITVLRLTAGVWRVKVRFPGERPKRAALLCRSAAFGSKGKRTGSELVHLIPYAFHRYIYKDITMASRGPCRF